MFDFSLLQMRPVLTYAFYESGNDVYLRATGYMPYEMAQPSFTATCFANGLVAESTLCAGTAASNLNVYAISGNDDDDDDDARGQQDVAVAMMDDAQASAVAGRHECDDVDDDNHDLDGIGRLFNDHEDDDDDDDDDWYFDETVYGRIDAERFGDKIERARKNLEVQWQIDRTNEECDLDEVREDPGAAAECGSDVCSTCHGHGTVPCRFCRGTGVMWLSPSSSTTGGDGQGGADSSFPPCPVCQQGMETCRDCKGSGRIAKWTRVLASDRKSVV